MKRIVVCGDSFNCGIGCPNLFTQPYGVLLADKLGADLVTLARGSASNFITHLQAQYAADMQPKPDLVIIGVTSYDRVEWITEKSRDMVLPLSGANINYHEYPPHHRFMQEAPDFYLKDDPSYNPILLSEQIGGIDDYLSIKQSEYGKHDYYKRLHNEPHEKLRIICKNYVNVQEGEIKRDYDLGVILKAYLYVKSRGIRCIILSTDEKLHAILPKEDIHFWCWFTAKVDYPDTVGSGHASEEAHAIIAQQLAAKLGAGSTTQEFSGN